jgi:hypothetical protein
LTAYTVIFSPFSNCCADIGTVSFEILEETSS